jgi:hypothetical protein
MPKYRIEGEIYEAANEDEAYAKHDLAKGREPSVTVTRIGDREIKPPESNRDLLDALRTAGGKAVRAVGPYVAAGAAGAAAGAPLMGVGAIPGAIAGMTAYGLGSTAADLMTGGQASQGVENLMTRAGLPEYDTALERMASSGVRGALGGFSGAQSAAALQAARGTVPQTTTQRIIDIMAQSPGAQTAGAGIAGVSAQGAREVGLPEPVPSLVGMAASTAPFVRMGSFRPETPPVQPGGATRPPANAPTPPISGATTGRPALTQPPVTPMPPQDVRMGNVARLERAGVPVSPGQRSGAPLTQTVESVMKYLPPSAPRSARFMDDQMRSYTKALLSHAGINADTATPDVLSTAQRRFGDIYNDLEQSTVLGGPDEKMIDDLARAEQIVGQGAPQNIKDSFIGYRDAVLNWASGTPRQGQTFKGLAEDLGAEIRKAERSNEAGSVKNAQALITLRNALFGLVERQASPELANAWRQANREYAIFKAIEDSMLDPSQVTLNTGFINPRKIGNIQMKLRSDEWTQGDEDADSFTNLVKAGMALIPDPIPNSGTAQRMFAQDILQGGRQMFNSPAGPAIGAASGAAGMTGFGAASAFDPISAFGVPYLGSRFWYGDAPQSLRPIAAASAVGSQQRQKTKREKLAEELKRKRQ